MREERQACEIERELRRAFGALVGEALPAAARARGWPVAHPAAFERLLLDHVLDAPFETALAGRRPGAFELAIAVEVAARMLEGEVCVAAMQRRSRALRAAAPRCAVTPAARACAGDVGALMRRAASERPDHRPGGRGRR